MLKHDDIRICKFSREDLKWVYLIKIRKFKYFWRWYKVNGLIREFETREHAQIRARELVNKDKLL